MLGMIRSGSRDGAVGTGTFYWEPEVGFFFGAKVGAGAHRKFLASPLSTNFLRCDADFESG